MSADRFQRLQAWFDRELPETERFEFEQTLKDDPALQLELQALGALREGMRGLARQPAPGPLRERVLTTMKKERRSWPVRLAWACATLAAGLILGLWLWPRYPADLPVMVADHVEPMPEEGSLRTGNAPQLEEWLRGKLEFKPRLPRWDWAQLLSGRPCFIRSRWVARVRYRLGTEEFSLFVAPTTNASERPLRDCRVAGYRALLWTEAGQEYVLVISDAAAVRLPKSLLPG